MAKKKVRHELDRINATPLERRMAWILYEIRGEKAALTFIGQAASVK